jgi:hypothetical protein
MARAGISWPTMKKLPTPTTRIIKWVHSDISDESVVTVFSSDVESLKKGITNTSNNRANKTSTTLLVGETGVGNPSVLEYIANVLIGNDIDYFF